MKNTNAKNAISTIHLLLLLAVFAAACSVIEEVPLNGAAPISTPAVATPTLNATPLPTEAPTAVATLASIDETSVSTDSDELASNDIAAEDESADTTGSGAASAQAAIDSDELAQAAPLALLKRTLFLAGFVENGEVTKPLVASELSLQFDGTAVSGSAGCNSYSGVLVMDSSNLSISRVVTTRKACVPEVMEQEARFLLALESAETLTVKDGNLVIEHAFGELHFSPLPPSGNDIELSLGAPDSQLDQDDTVDSDADGVSDANVPAPIERADVFPAPVESFEIITTDGFPVEATITVRGSFSDACPTVIGKEQDLLLEERIIYFSVKAANQSEVCSTVVTPYEVSYPFDILGLPAGDYRVIVNDVEGTFNLPEDN